MTAQTPAIPGASEPSPSTERPDIAGHPGWILRTLLGWLVAPTTWLAVMHILAGFFLGLLAFVLLVVGLSFGVSLLAVFGLGIVIFIGTYWFAERFAALERARFALLLGEHIPAPPSPADQPGHRGTKRMWRSLTHPTRWKNMAYALVRLPLGMVESAPVIFFWSTGLALFTLPAYNGELPGGAAHLGAMRFAGPGWMTLAGVSGALLLLAAPVVTRATAVLDALIARGMLGPARGAALTARIDELETSRARVIDAAEAERRRIERDLHDGAQQRLVALAMELGRAKAKFATDPQAAAELVDQAHEQAKEALAELRNLVRGVHPPVLSDRGLDAALSGLAALSPVPVTVRVDLAARPSAAVEAIAYFVVAEALTNVAKHAEASQAQVVVTGADRQLSVLIFDDGVGGADPAGQGLSGLAARVAGIDGRLRVTSPDGGPTTIEVVLPCGS
ncbi:MAG TPA: sensor histidine kinase [Streptosporangiaceae bacterium]|nr:sensor histidine kinase [Streptosporangiaceae bacterium]